MPLVTPTPIPAYPPAPQPTDDRVTFSAKAFALASAYEPQRISFNLLATQTNTNAAYAHERAGAAHDSAVLAGQKADIATGAVTAVNQTVADILAAKDAIQAGPVASVMGRTGVVVGLVEASSPAYNSTKLMSDAPVGQPVIYYDAVGSASDWPLATTGLAWAVHTIGDTNVKNQRAAQTNGASPGLFERNYAGGVWTAWQRMIGDRTVLDRSVTVNANAASVSVSAADGAICTVVVNVNTTIQVAAPRAPGDQIVLRVLPVGGFSIAFSSNVRLPVGVSSLSVSVWQQLTVTLIAKTDNSGWDLHVGSKHA